MIYTTLESLGQYRGCSKNLDAVVRYLESHPLAELPLGKTVLEGEKVFVNVMETTTRPAADADYEVHARYADLQVDITGQEGFEVLLGPGTVVAPYDPDKDFGLVAGPTEGTGVLGGSRCVLFPAGEPHKPTLAVGEPGQPVRKAVFKLEWND